MEENYIENIVADLRSIRCQECDYKILEQDKLRESINNFPYTMIGGQKQIHAHFGICPKTTCTGLLIPDFRSYTLLISFFPQIKQIFPRDYEINEIRQFYNEGIFNPKNDRKRKAISIFEQIILNSNLFCYVFLELSYWKKQERKAWLI